MQPNHQTKTHRPNPCTISTQIQTLDNLAQYPSSFHPLSGGRITRNEQPPQQWLDARALNQPLVNLMSRKAIVYLYLARFSPFPERSKTGSLIIYQGNKSAALSLRISLVQGNYIELEQDLRFIGYRFIGY